MKRLIGSTWIMAVVLAAGIQAGTARGAATWNGSTSTDWGNGANWTGGTPGPGVDVVIDGAGTYQPTINLSGGSVTIKSLTVGQTIASTLTFSNGDVSTKYLNVTGNVVIGALGTLTHTDISTTALGETHRLFLDVGGNLVIDPGGRIDVEGKGYDQSNGPGGGYYKLSGGGYGGEGAGATGADDYGTTYGSVTNPVNCGSGGCNSDGAGGGVGGPGAGAIVLRVTGAVTNDGVITARGSNCLGGGSNSQGAGAGGTINLTAASITGAGVISAPGGDAKKISDGTNLGKWGGGGGRIAVRLTGGGAVPDAVLANITAYGGYGSIRYGAAGTVYIRDSQPDRLIVNNNHNSSSSTLLRDTTCKFSTIVVTNKGVLAVGTNGVLDLTGCALSTRPSTYNNITSRLLVGRGNGQLTWTGVWTNSGAAISWVGTNPVAIGSLVVTNGGFLTHENGPANAITLQVSGDLTLGTDSYIWVQGMGYAGGQGGTGPGAGSSASGGGHGGQGHDLLGLAMTYGSVTNPITAGSGGAGGASTGRPGGGVVVVRATGTVTVDGIVDAKGNSTSAGGGAGGSVNIRAGALQGSGRIGADGGDGYANNGGGGRIAVVLTNSATFGNVTLSAVSGGGHGWKGGRGNDLFERRHPGVRHSHRFEQSDGGVPLPSDPDRLAGDGCRCGGCAFAGEGPTRGIERLRADRLRQLVQRGRGERVVRRRHGGAGRYGGGHGLG